MAPLTCHVIEENTNHQPHTGIPARGMRVVLRCMSHRNDTSVFTTSTTDEGEVKDWPGWKDPNYNLDQFLPEILETPESTWQLGFGVGIYFGQQNTSYHWIDINFVMQHGRSYHICLILQPYQYRTFILPGSPWPIPDNLIPAALMPHGSTLINNTHTRPQKTPRKKLSQTQQLALMQHYTDDPYPKKETYESLANHMNLEKWRVQRWFVEKRRRMRKSKQIEGLEYAQNNTEGSEHQLIDPRLVEDTMQEDAERDLSYQPLHGLNQQSAASSRNNGTNGRTSPMDCGDGSEMQISDCERPFSQATTLCGEISPTMDVQTSTEKMLHEPEICEVHDTRAIVPQEMKASADRDIHPSGQSTFYEEPATDTSTAEPATVDPALLTREGAIGTENLHLGEPTSAINHKPAISTGPSKRKTRGKRGTRRSKRTRGRA